MHPGIVQVAIGNVPGYEKLMSDREMVLDLVRRMPEDATLKDIVTELELFTGIDVALEQVSRGEWISEEEMRSELRKWVTE